ncbi:MAG: nicotinamidase [Planctomycetes bacterium]|nr:nicotinamidase [Planctomycetota bacterium]
MAKGPFEPGDALLIVDVQNDFCPGGALPVPHGDEVIPELNGWIAAAREAGIPVFASRDWHPADHASFRATGGQWPPHCIQGTAGAEFHQDLHFPSDVAVISKGTSPDRDGYSAFGGTNLAERLRHAGIRRLWVGGLALDYCVRASVLDALATGLGVHVIRAGTRAVDVHPGDGERAVAEMARAGAVIEEEAWV